MIKFVESPLCTVLTSGSWFKRKCLSTSFFVSNIFPHSGHMYCPARVSGVLRRLIIWFNYNLHLNIKKKGKSCINYCVWLRQLHTYSSSYSLPSSINSRTLGPPFTPPRLPASWTVIFPLPISMSSSLLLRLLDKHVTSICDACLRTQSHRHEKKLDKDMWLLTCSNRSPSLNSLFTCTAFCLDVKYFVTWSLDYCNRNVELDGNT